MSAEAAMPSLFPASLFHPFPESLLPESLSAAIFATAESCVSVLQ